MPDDVYFEHDKRKEETDPLTVSFSEEFYSNANAFSYESICIQIARIIANAEINDLSDGTVKSLFYLHLPWLATLTETDIYNILDDAFPDTIHDETYWAIPPRIIEYLDWGL